MTKKQSIMAIITAILLAFSFTSSAVVTDDSINNNENEMKRKAVKTVKENSMTDTSVDNNPIEEQHNDAKAKRQNRRAQVKSAKK